LVWILATRREPYQDTRRRERFGFPFCPRAAERLQQQCRFRGALRYERRGTLLKFIAGQNGGDTQLTGRPPENLAIGQVIELFSLVKLFEDFRSARWVTGQHAGGEIECLTGSLDQMWPMRHRSPALSIPPGDRTVMNPPTRLV
jgi:hypothetical protein